MRAIAGTLAPAVVSADLNGAVLVSSGAGQLAVLPVGGVGEAIEARADERGAGRRLADLIGDGPVLTDAPQKAAELLTRAGARAQVWDVLELAALLVPACPGGSLERVTSFFGVAVHGSGVAQKAQRLLMLFELLLALLERIDSQTLLHVTRLGVGLDWPLRGLFSQVLSARSLSPLESGALAAGTPIAGWIANGAPSRRRRRSSERKWSSAALRAIWQSHVFAVPRRGSNRRQRRSARSNVAAVRSSAAFRSPVR